MSTNSITFDVEWNGDTYHVETKSSDVARVEAQFGKSFGKLAEEMPTGLFLALAYYRLKQDGVDVPDSYDAFLNGDPDLDMGNVGDEEGKDSTNEIPVSIGNSSPSPMSGTSPLSNSSTLLTSGPVSTAR